tara:strand:+ start:147 stop:968 length:822 start_codon:yes stop_codon:yes gene_type:complete
VSHSAISLGLGLGGGKSATSSGGGGGTPLTDELAYTGGLWTESNYEISVAPIMHFDSAILDGADGANNPANGADVPVWGDRSGFGTDYDLSQDTASYQPHFYDVGGLRGVDISEYQDHILNLATGFAVASADDLTQIIIATNTQSARNSISGLSAATHTFANSILFTYGTQLRIGGVSQTSPPTFSKTVPNLHVLTKDDTALAYWWQGGSVTFSQTATVNNTFTKMFTLYPSYGNDCRIHEVLVFSSEVSLANLNIIKNYANEKYSMSVSDLT